MYTHIFVLTANYELRVSRKSHLRDYPTLETVKGCVSLKKYKSQNTAIEVTMNSKEENSKDFCLDFVQEFGVLSPSSKKRTKSFTLLGS